MLRLFAKRKRKTEQPKAREDSQKTPAVTRLGRRFLDAPYALPKDQEEINRLDLQHFLLRQVFKGNDVSPLSHPGAILDVGCGTGRWGIEMARDFPMSRVVGVDLEDASMTKPLPTNYSFMRGNVLNGLPFDEPAFAFVHQRLLVAAIPALQWPAVLRELMRVTCSGGWVEIVECGIEGQNVGVLTKQFLSWGAAASAAIGLDARIVPQLGEYLRIAGLRNVQVCAHDIPLGAWGGRIGTMLETDMLSAFSALKALYTQASYGTEAQFDALLKELPAEWNYLRTSYRFYAFYGQK
jgi:ubiquinone/menaquinone biosynthesis C-methylase UbiE